MTVKELQDTTDRHEKILAENGATLSQHSAMLEQIIASLAKLAAKDSPSSSTHFQQQTNVQGRPIRLDFPRFNGEDPEGWLFQAEQFFTLNPMPADQRVTMAAIHLKGDAVAWYRWLHQSMGELTWLQFSTALCKRFGSRHNMDPMSSLSKLVQQGSVKQYITSFENLINLVPGIQDPHQVSLFLSGLRGDIQAGVRLLAPTSLSHAFELALNKEDEIQTTTAFSRSSARTYSRLTPIAATKSTTTVSPSLPTGVKRLTWAEQKERRDKGLCFNCDEFFKPGHRCSTPQLLLLDASASMLDDDHDTDCLETEDTNANMEVSLYALTGSISPTTMRVSVHHRNKPLSILIDSGSTHNFVHPSVARIYGILVQPQPSFNVMIANGGSLSCTGACKDVNLTLQGYNFTASFSVLAIKGCDMVLGVQWLRTLGSITWDFQQLVMQFTRFNQLFTVIGNGSPMAHMVDETAMHRALLQEQQGFLLSLQASETRETITLMQCTEHDSIRTILSRFDDLFGTPRSLPPHRSHDHKIPLLEDANPVNIRPYRYPHFQKSEIEKVVKELRDTGFIRPSTSPFSSRC